MTTPNGISINGTFGKFIAAVVIALLIAGVVGIWNMNGTMNRLVATVDFIRATQMDMAKDVRENTERIYRYRNE